MNAHKCPAPGCDAVVPRNMLACRKHWYSIPKPLRDEVWRAYDGGYGMGSPEHSIAIAEACAFLRGEAQTA